MPRGARLAFQDSFYHVFNRGANKQQIFFRKEDYQFFLKKLQGLYKKYDHSVLAYCLMPNHFHISLRTRKSPLAKIMSSLMTSYAMYTNRTYSRVGPLFQNRYKSILIESDVYFLHVSKYIYYNPVEAGLIKDPMAYEYSSLREALQESPRFLLDNETQRLIGDTKGSLRQYKRYILDQDTMDFSEVENLFQSEESVSGTAGFATRAKRKYVKTRRKKAFSFD